MGNQFTRIRLKKKQTDKKVNQRSTTKGILDEQSIKDQAMAMAKHELFIASLSSQSKMLQETAILEPPRHSYSGRGNYGGVDFTRSYSTQVRRDIDSLLDPVPSMHLRKVQFIPAIPLLVKSSHTNSKDRFSACETILTMVCDVLKLTSC